MRLTPIESPKGLYMKLAYWLTRKMYGKVITPMKIIYARQPKILGVGQKILQSFKKLSIDPGLVELIRYQTAMENGCGFCVDISAYHLEKYFSQGKIMAISNYLDSDLFTEKEKSALTYAREMTLYKQASDETFNKLKETAGERQVVEITYCVAAEAWLNNMNTALGIGSDGFCRIPLNTSESKMV